MDTEAEISRGHFEGSEDEPVWGVRAFAPIIKRTERQTFHLLKTGQLPAKKIGGSYVSTRRKLRAALFGEPV